MGDKTLYWHPLSLLGYCVTVGGWVWLIGGSSADVGLGRNVINIHGAVLALATILTGIGMVLAGMINATGQSSPATQKAPTSGSRSKKVKTESATILDGEVDEAELIRRQMMERGINV